MKNSLFLLIISLLSGYSAYSHGGHKAFFTLEKTSSKVLLTVRMEENDVKKEIKFNEEEGKSLELSIVNYLKERMSISFDDQPVEFEFSSSYSSKGYIYLKFESTNSKNNVKKIRMKNRCFVDFDHLYYNVFRIVYGDNDVTYKLSKDRVNIEHYLN